MRHRLAVLPQYVLPKQAITALAGRAASARGGKLTTAAIRWFVRHYGVDMNEAAEPDIAAYPTFNEFFPRALKPGARPLAASALVCPGDGAISRFGDMDHNRIVQAKGHHYLSVALVCGDEALATQFDHGSFATLYLAPKDYHRIHMPCDGTLTRMIHVPGALFSVNPPTARGIPGLFARNERVVCVFDSPRGPFVMVLVGATIVGSVATVWHGVVTPPRVGDVREWRYGDRPVVLRRGEEMGRFMLGSTVVLLFPRGDLRFNPQWGPERSIRLGEAMADYAPGGS